MSKNSSNEFVNKLLLIYFPIAVILVSVTSIISSLFFYPGTVFGFPIFFAGAILSINAGIIIWGYYKKRKKEMRA